MNDRHKPSLNELQKWFLWRVAQTHKGHHDAIPEPSPSALDFINSTKTFSRDERLMVYSRAYIWRLIDAIKEDFEVSLKLMGNERFETICFDFLAKHPSQTPSLTNLAIKFPQFVKTGGKHYDVSPPVVELLHFEWALNETFYSKEANGLDLARLEKLESNDPKTLFFQFHPSVKVYEYEFPVDEIYEREELMEASAVSLAMFCHNSDSKFYRLCSSEKMLFRTLHQGTSLGDALENLTQNSDFNMSAEKIQSCFQYWINRGIICDIVFTKET